jgi:hypothetical protein
MYIKKKEKKRKRGTKFCGWFHLMVTVRWDICRTEIPMGTMSGTQVQEP